MKKEYNTPTMEILRLGTLRPINAIAPSKESVPSGAPARRTEVF